jgi:hypothetical protein
MKELKMKDGEGRCHGRIKVARVSMSAVLYRTILSYIVLSYI